MEKPLIIRVDASTQIGTGHLMRCLSLAQAWKDASGRVVFITACHNEGLLQRLQEEEFDIHELADSFPDTDDWDYTRDILAAHPDAWVVLDGYHFDEVYQQRVKEAGHPLLVIDDMAHLNHYYADIVLNQNLHAGQSQYSCEPYTHLLLGTRYVLLRREFLAWRSWQRQIPEAARRVLVTLGGGDPENHTLKIIQALQRANTPGLEAIAVVGASNPHVEALEAAIRQGAIPIRLIRDTKNMAELMAWADMAVSSAGTTTWELLFLGMPTLFVISADNQCYIAEQIESRKVGIALGWAKNISVELLAKAVGSLIGDMKLRAEMSKYARQIVDGQGAQRVIASMQEFRAHQLTIRAATQEDCRLLWEWANDSAVRAASFSSEFITWEEHVSWFRQKLADPDCLLYVVMGEEVMPVGQVRFDIDSGGNAEISTSIGSPFRDYGYGAEAIRIASERLFQEADITRIYAHIKQENITSARAFTKAGYRETGGEMVKGQPALQMVLDKNE